MTLPAPRVTFSLIVFACISLLSIALYMEHVEGMEPCPLCMTQRVFVVLTGIVALLAVIVNPKTWGLKVAAIGTALMCVIGGSFSSRQLWLQSLPEDQVPACGPSLSYMLDTLPILETLQVMMRGNGNCAEVVWTFLGLSIPGWMLVGFCGLAIAALSTLFSPKKL